ncbi:uncharacterized protein LOC141852960 [Brevipalpus obovatus]|uniref:uncharacterized protein LOC141852960 n=1 Tax=Brevipalpus obovatus TaxID=246614 RepID=UPI003D9EFC1B
MTSTDKFRKTLRSLLLDTKPGSGVGNSRQNSYDDDDVKLMNSKDGNRLHDKHVRGERGDIGQEEGKKKNKKNKNKQNKEQGSNNEHHDDGEFGRICDSLAMASNASDVSRQRLRGQFFKFLTSATLTNMKALDKTVSYIFKIIKTEMPEEGFEDIKTFGKFMKKQKKSLKQLAKQRDENKWAIENIFKPLIYGLAISTLQNPENLSKVQSGVEELNLCLEKCLSKSKDPKEPHWADVLLDFMLSHFSKDSPFLSSLMVKIFSSFCKEITSEGIEQLKTALLTQHLGDDDDEDSSGDDSGESDGEDFEDLEDDSDEVSDEFKNKVRLALGPAAIFDPDKSDDDLDDDEMLQLDEALAEAFRGKLGASKAKAKAEAEEALRFVHLKCLDMVLKLLRQRKPILQHVIELVFALLELCRIRSSPNERQFRSKIAKLFFSLPAPKSFNLKQDKPDLDPLKGIFKRTIEVCWRVEDQRIQEGGAKICLWIHSICSRASLETDWIKEFVNKAVNDFFTKSNCCIAKSFFAILFQNPAFITMPLLEKLTSFLSANLRPFKKRNGLSILCLCLRNMQLSLAPSKSNELKKCLTPTCEKVVESMMTAIKNSKSAHLSEYFSLLTCLSKYIDLQLKAEHLKVLESLPKSALKSLNKSDRSFRKTLLQSQIKPRDTQKTSAKEEIIKVDKPASKTEKKKNKKKKNKRECEPENPSQTVAQSVNVDKKQNQQSPKKAKRAEQSNQTLTPPATKSESNSEVEMNEDVPEELKNESQIVSQETLSTGPTSSETGEASTREKRKSSELTGEVPVSPKKKRDSGAGKSKSSAPSSPQKTPDEEKEEKESITTHEDGHPPAAKAPSSPAKSSSPAKTPSSPTKALSSPAKALSPAKTPSFPAETPSSPAKALSSPAKATNKLSLNDLSDRFEISVTPPPSRTEESTEQIPETPISTMIITDSSEESSPPSFKQSSPRRASTRTIAPFIPSPDKADHEKSPESVAFLKSPEKTILMKTSTQTPTNKTTPHKSAEKLIVLKSPEKTPAQKSLNKAIASKPIESAVLKSPEKTTSPKSPVKVVPQKTPEKTISQTMKVSSPSPIMNGSIDHQSTSAEKSKTNSRIASMAEKTVEASKIGKEVKTNAKTPTSRIEENGGSDQNDKSDDDEFLIPVPRVSVTPPKKSKIPKPKPKPKSVPAPVVEEPRVLRRSARLTNKG